MGAAHASPAFRAWTGARSAGSSEAPIKTGRGRPCGFVRRCRQTQALERHSPGSTSALVRRQIGERLSPQPGHQFVRTPSSRAQHLCGRRRSKKRRLIAPVNGSISDKAESSALTRFNSALSSIMALSASTSSETSVRTPINSPARAPLTSWDGWTLTQKPGLQRPSGHTPKDKGPRVGPLCLCRQGGAFAGSGAAAPQRTIAARDEQQSAAVAGPVLVGGEVELLLGRVPALAFLCQLLHGR